MDIAINTQHTATYGDFRSPIRANFQNVPRALQLTIDNLLEYKETFIS